MALTVIFKNNKSPVNKFDKTFDETTLTVDVVLKEETDIFKPTFIIYSVPNLWLFNYIDATASFGRKYFIVDIRSVGNNRYEVDSKTDVLSTWATEIRSNRAVIKRQQNLYNLYLDDPDFHVLNYERIQTLRFPDNALMKTLQYVLVTNGAGSSNEQAEFFSQLKNEGGDIGGTES